MNKRKVIVWGIAALLLAFLAWKLHSSHFDWGSFWRACRAVRWPLVSVAILLIYTNAVIRALRWSIFLKPSLPSAERPPWTSLIGTQFLGFAGLAAFGRIGELIRPYLISKRTGLSFSSQVAVVAVERIFDLGAFGLIFATNLLLSPALMTLPYHERYHQFGYAIFGLTLFLLVFVVAVRVAGPFMAGVFRGIVGLVSKPAGETVAAKVLEFRDGLNTIGSFGDFVAVALLSLLMWMSIAVAYILTMRAFPSPVHDLTISPVILLMGFSVVGGIVQLPGIGGGAQIATGLALNKLLGIPQELATSAGIILWLMSTMSVILPGLIFARFEQVSLLSLARESGEAEREREHPEEASTTI